MTVPFSRIFAATFALSLLLLGTGCTAPVGASSALATDSAGQCKTQCAQIGMELSAVAIMADRVGCVCKVSSGAPNATVDEQAASTAGGMAAIALQEEAARQQQQQQSRTY